MSNNEELDRLVEAALVDNKLTTKEIKILVKKAKELGIDKDEFMLEIEARKYLAKKANPKYYKGLFVHNKTLDITIILSIVAIIIATIFLIFRTTDSIRLRMFAWHNNFKYTDWQEALVNYDFKNAYALIPIYKEIKYKKASNYRYIKGTIAEAEVNYLFSEGFIERGLEVAQENYIKEEYENEYGITNNELQKIILKYFNIEVTKQKFNEALKLIQNYKLVLENESSDEISRLAYISDINAMEKYNSVVIPYNEVLNSLLQKVSYKQVPDFNYSELINLYKPEAKSKYLGIKKIKSITQPTFEERVVKNILGNPKKDAYGRVITEKVMVEKGGEIYYREEELYSFYMINNYQKEAIRILKENGIKY